MLSVWSKQNGGLGKVETMIRETMSPIGLNDEPKSIKPWGVRRNHATAHNGTTAQRRRCVVVSLRGFLLGVTSRQTKPIMVHFRLNI